MADFVVAHTDAEWFPPGPEEREILAGVGAGLIAAECANEEQVIELASGADGILNSRARMTGRVLRSLTRCRVIARYGIGVDNIDLAAATSCGIVVANVPDFCVDEVSTHVMALLLASARKLFSFSSMARGGDWSARLYPRISRLEGQVFGGIGYGRIGRAVANKVQALGMRVLVHDPYAYGAALQQAGFAAVPMDELLAYSDFVSLHVPLTAETRGLVDERALRRMKPSAVLINCSRGGVVNEAALVRALREGWIAGAALDVMESEPPAPDHPLLSLPGVILTPHCGGYSGESFRDVRRGAAEAVARVLTGQLPRSIVNPEVCARAGAQEP